jgi:hypothetical protein
LTKGFSGADLKNLFQATVMQPIRRILKNNKNNLQVSGISADNLDPISL